MIQRWRKWETGSCQNQPEDYKVRTELYNLLSAKDVWRWGRMWKADYQFPTLRMTLAEDTVI